MRALLAPLLLLALLLAGCSGGDGGEPTAPSELDGNAPPGGSSPLDPVVYQVSGTVTLGVGTSTVVTFTSGDIAQVEFAVPTGATLVLAELRWDSPVQSLDLCLHSPEDGDTGGVPNCPEVVDGGTPLPTNYITAVRKEPRAEPGWLALPYAHVLNAAQPYDLAVSIFFGPTAVPDGYTAFA